MNKNQIMKHSKMYFSQEDIKKLEIAYAEVEGKYQTLLLKFATHKFSNEQAAEFAMHGFVRRVKTIKRCIDTSYRICPLFIDEKPSSEKLNDVVINLQAFVFNVYGALDNLACVWVKEKNIHNSKGKPLSNGQIGLSEKYKDVRNSLPDDIQKYLNTERHKSWFSHIENFRHSLAHRIPLYVPPYVSNEEEIKKEKELEQLRCEALKKHQFEEYERFFAEIDLIGTFIPWMTHSFGETSPQAVFHAQIIADWNTVAELSENFIKELKS